MKQISGILCIVAVLLSCTPRGAVYPKISGTIIGDSMTELQLLVNGSLLNLPIVGNHFEWQKRDSLPQRITLIYRRGICNFYCDSTDMQLILYTARLQKNVVQGCVVNKWQMDFEENLPVDLVQRKQYIADFIGRYPTTILAVDILSQYSTRLFEVKELRALFNKMPEDIREGYGKALDDYLKVKEKSDIGEKFIDIELNDRTGTAVKLSSVVRQNKLTLLDFWASSCGPCRLEGKMLLQDYQVLKRKGLEVYAVSLDRNREKWIKAIETDKTPWIHVLGDEAELHHFYPVKAIPQIFVIDQQGKILKNNTYGPELINFCKEYLR